MTWRSASDIVKDLGGARMRGHKGRCACPVQHHSSGDTLAVSQTRDGRILVFCHAGCDQREVIAALKAKGLWGDGELVMDPGYPGHLTTHYDGVDNKTDRAKRQEALDIWDRCRAYRGTHAETYLRARNIRQPPSDQLRYHPAEYHWPTKKKFPVLCARISDNHGFCAVQRTFLDPNAPRKIDFGREIPKKLTTGPMGAGAVRLRMPRETLGLAEGVETALSCTQIYSVPVWATLGAKRLSRIDLPDCVERLIIFADAGKVGIEAAFEAQDIYEHQGYAVEVITPQAHNEHSAASDFNDVLQERG